MTWWLSAILSSMHSLKLEIGHVQEHDGESELCLPFGAKVPYESVTVIPE